MDIPLPRIDVRIKGSLSIHSSNSLRLSSFTDITPHTTPISASDLSIPISFNLNWKFSNSLSGPAKIYTRYPLPSHLFGLFRLANILFLPAYIFTPINLQLISLLLENIDLLHFLKEDETSSPISFLSPLWFFPSLSADLKGWLLIFFQWPSFSFCTCIFSIRYLPFIFFPSFSYLLFIVVVITLLDWIIVF